MKPANILIDALGKARLADLDVSVDSRTRTSTQHATRTLLAGYSAGFVAPEVYIHGSSPASDIFSVGKTAATEPVKAACCPSSEVGGVQPEGYDGATAGADAFVEALVKENAAERPSALEAQQHAFCGAVARFGGSSDQGRMCVVKAGARCIDLEVRVCAQRMFDDPECPSVQKLSDSGLLTELCSAGFVPLGVGVWSGTLGVQGVLGGVGKGRCGSRPSNTEEEARPASLPDASLQ